MEKSRNAIGIDLGTCFSSVGVFRNGKVEMIPDDQGNLRMPSCVSFTESGRLFGEAAKSRANMNLASTVYG